MTQRLAISSGSKFEELAGYSRAVADGEWVFISATAGLEAGGGFSPDTIQQARRALAIISAGLAEAGASLADVVRVRVYLADRADLVPVSKILGETFTAPRPANSTIICGLPDEAIKVELEMTALKRGLSIKQSGLSEPDSSEEKRMNTKAKAETLPISSQATFLYYKDLTEPARFYGDLLGLEKTFDKGWVKFFQLTEKSCVGLVDEAHGFHKATDDNSVMVSIETPNLEAWYERAKTRGATFKTHPKFNRAGEDMVTSFMLRDPGGYTVEFFRFNRRD